MVILCVHKATLPGTNTEEQVVPLESEDHVPLSTGGQVHIHDIFREFWVE